MGCKRDLFFISKDFYIIKWLYEMKVIIILINKIDINLSWRLECVNWFVFIEILLVGMYNKNIMIGKVIWYDCIGILIKIIILGLFK